MTGKISGRIFLITLFILIYLFSSNAETFSGVSTIELNTPVTTEIKKAQQKLAFDSLSTYLTFWINEFFDNCLHPRNPISKHFLDTFIATCKQNTKRKSYIEGRRLITEITVPQNTLDSIIAEHNSTFDTKALHYWNQSSAARRSNTINAVVDATARSLFYSMAHIGSPITIPGAPTGGKLTKSARALLQELIDKLDISFSNPIITGKPMDSPRDDVLITVTVDTVPLPYFFLIVFRPDGKRIMTTKTNADGVVSLSNLKIPFVANGTFLHIQPNLSAIIDPDLFFEAKFFGLKLTENSDQTVMCNIIKPVYSLTYKATSVNQMEIPTVFSDINTIHKFLTDSCFLQRVGEGMKTDIAFDIQCQVSNYTHDEREQNQIKVEAKVVINKLKPQGLKVEKIAVLNDKYYEIGSKLPVGLFFWESSSALRGLIRKMLDEL